MFKPYTFYGRSLEARILDKDRIKGHCRDFIHNSALKLRRAGYGIKQHNVDYMVFMKDDLAGILHTGEEEIIFAAGKRNPAWHMQIDLYSYGLSHPKQVYTFRFDKVYWLSDRNVFLNIMLKSRNYDHFLSIIEQKNTELLLKKL